MTKIEPGSKFTHIKEGYGVTVQGSEDRESALYVKDANDAAWQKAVMYSRDGEDGKLFVRAERDFTAKFAPQDSDWSEA